VNGAPPTPHRSSVAPAAEPAPGAPSPVRIVVAGGSLGGLSAALWLRDAGFDVDVHERSRAPLEGQGAGIVLNPATIRWLVERESLATADLGEPARHLRYLAADGTAAAELVSPLWFTSYDTVYRWLLAAFGRERYHLGEAVVGAEQDGRGVTVRLSSGASRSCELLVWADGIRSTGRRLLLGEPDSRYAGYVGWRGTIARSRCSAATRRALEDAITYCVLARSHALTYPIPAAGGPVMNWLWYRNVAPGAELDALMTDVHGVAREVSVPPGAVAPRHIAQLCEAGEDLLPAPLAELVRRTQHPFLQAVYDIDVPHMAFGRMCLIGDAAVALRPHAAAGAAKAAEDGYRLAEALRDAGGDVVRALTTWEARQLGLARRVLARTREAGDRSQFAGSWQVGDPLPFGLYEVGDSVIAAA
jgi:2,6-dihydroxypyridine 3-monooxygenase